MWEALAPLRRRHPAVRWIEADRLHLTLVFLGATEPARVAQIAEEVAAVAAATQPLEVSLGAAGGRVGGRRGGVAWLEVAAGREPVARLAQQLDQRLPGLRAGRINAPHLTVARAADEAVLADLRGIAATLDVRWAFERICLWRSHTGPRGSSYEELAAAMLGG